MYNLTLFSTSIHNGRYLMATLTTKSVYDRAPGTHHSLLQPNSLLSFPILFLSHFENGLSFAYVQEVRMLLLLLHPLISNNKMPGKFPYWLALLGRNDTSHSKNDTLHSRN